ncbi:relaxin-3-like [Myxocyprinus asiaticus]|uniref:relaxin-3-like n=1 Tax=Myxocyprinus asiaticus TaxID=70543 RepID=UPI002223A129|nr:relaxin-3-like [Myxocyprinus asiaticus]
MANHQKSAACETSTLFGLLFIWFLVKFIVLILYKMSRVFLALLIVCVFSVCVRVSTIQVELARDFGVKLCGREFIRAVIFTCGGSRWRRETDYSPFTLDSFQNSMGPDAGLSLSENTQQVSLSELLQVMSAQTQTDGERREMAELESADGVSGWLSAFFSSTPSGSTRASSVNRARPDRRKRNFSLGLAGMCCNQGCTKNDIGRLC